MINNKKKTNKNRGTRGGEGLVDGDDSNGSFSETTTASFNVDTVIGFVDGVASSGSTSFNYQFNIGLETSFTGEDSLAAKIDIGNTSQSKLGEIMDFDDTSDVLTLDGLTYTFPVGGATVVVGDNTDISAVYTGACSYTAFTDYMSDCGTGNSVGVGGNGVTAAMSYAFDSGFSLAGGVSSGPEKLGVDTYGIEAAYSADSYGVAVAYSDVESTTYWGVNAYYTFDDVASLSVGYETKSVEGSDSSSGFFVGLTFPELGPGSLNIAAATAGLFTDSDTEYYTYEASYAYPVNDGMTITPGVFIQETSGDDNFTGVAVKTSFSF
jgi:hypothetical protein